MNVAINIYYIQITDEYYEYLRKVATFKRDKFSRYLGYFIYIRHYIILYYNL